LTDRRRRVTRAGSGGEHCVAAKLREVAVKFNVGNLMLLLQFGNMSKELANCNTKLFAEKVIPRLADLFENEWEHQWWPVPLPKSERVVPTAVAAA